MSNTINNWLTTATIMDEERRAWWISVFDSPTVPIISMIPTLVNVPGYERVEAYMLDIDAITEERKEKLLCALAEKFNMPIAEARLEFERGVPILAMDVTVNSRDQGLFFSMIDDVDVESGSYLEDDFDDNS